jgi:peptidyl-prolyl cis-trans isomerase SurA
LKNKEVFLLSEILFNAKNKEELNKKYIRILESIEKEGFKNTATIYSISDTAKFGGLIGWIQKNQLSDLVIDEILKINIGEFTKPINVPSGLLIIKIDEKKIKESKIDFDLELKKIIQYEKNKKLRQFSFIHYKKVKNNLNIHEN